AIKCGSGVNQQESSEHKYGGRILSETVLQNVSTLRKTRTEYWLCNDVHFADFVPISLIGRNYVTSEDVRKHSKKTTKRDENPQENPHECVTKRSRKKWDKRKQDAELVFVMFIEWKAVWKVNAVRKTQNGDLPSKPKTNAVLCSRHPRQRPRTRREEGNRSNEKGKGANDKKAESCA
ncbi:hypothetical protein ACTXT7_017529, partial [Hymenolepis weldensis]